MPAFREIEIVRPVPAQSSRIKMRQSGPFPHTRFELPGDSPPQGPSEVKDGFPPKRLSFKPLLRRWPPAVAETQEGSLAARYLQLENMLPGGWNESPSSRGVIGLPPAPARRCFAPYLAFRHQTPLGRIG